MKFKHELPVKIYYGSKCLSANDKELVKLGRKAFIMTGPKSGKLSGALEDVLEALRLNNIEFSIFDRVENNPSFKNVEEAGKIAADFGADFVIGIGGGSPLDASKAAAVLAVNRIKPVELYKNMYKNNPLPIAAIPTTAGTGSEVTPYSILTRHDLKTKMSFGSRQTFPQIAFVDPGYLRSVPVKILANTAVDALSHSIEGYLSKRSTPVSDLYAVESIRQFGKSYKNLLKLEINEQTRNSLMYSSMLGGMVITHTGTTIVHSLGYYLTYFYDVPHGMANGVFLEEFLSYNYTASEQKINNILSLCELKSIREFGKAIEMLVGNFKLTCEDARKCAESVPGNKVSSNPENIDVSGLYGIVKKSCC